MKLLIMQSSPATSSLLRPNILLSTLFSDTLNLCSSLSMRDQVSNPYKLFHTIIALVDATVGFIRWFLSREAEDFLCWRIGPSAGLWASRTDFYASDGIRAHSRSVRVARDCACLRLNGYRNWPSSNYNFESFGTLQMHQDNC